MSIPEAAIYPIADADHLGVDHLPAVVEELASAGAQWIQVRIKDASDRQRYETLEACCRRVEGSGVQLWIDDRVDLACMLPCRGVHLGQTDMAPRAARSLLPESTWIGFSTHDLAQLQAAAADEDVDVIALGPIFTTRSKSQPDPTVGTSILRQARGLTDKPLVAIGGIDAENLAEVLQTGVNAVAVIGSLGRDPEDVGNGLRRLLDVCKEMQ